MVSARWQGSRPLLASGQLPEKVSDVTACHRPQPVPGQAHLMLGAIYGPAGCDEHRGQVIRGGLPFTEGGGLDGLTRRGGCG